ncbi:MAG: HXXEE domain-containing protein [Methylovirgula sp.]
MSLAELSWLALAAYACHILEEYALNWRDWARAVLGLPVEWSDFYVTNSVVVVLGIAQGGLAPIFVLGPLAFAALMLINATFFHVLPFLRTRGHFSPGLVTAIVLFYPIGIAEFVAAQAEGRLNVGIAATAFITGTVLMAFPIALLMLRSHPYFRQT